MVLEAPRRSLRAVDVPVPRPGPGQLLLRVHACGICRTDLHLLDGEVAVAAPPRILGHQIVATVEGDGRRVGVPWLGWTCGVCAFCRSGRENLCERARFTGCDLDGGYGGVRGRRRAVLLRPAGRVPGPAGRPAAVRRPDRLPRAADVRRRRPSRPLRVRRRGAHPLPGGALARDDACTRSPAPATSRAQAFARELGAVWAGGSDEAPPEPLDAAIVFAPVGALVPVALGASRPAGRSSAPGST